MRYVLALLALLLGPGWAEACPDPRLWGERHSLTGAQAYSPYRLGLVAGGEHHLANCPYVDAPEPPTGWVIRPPDFTIDITRLDGYALEFRVEARCDAVLLINTAARNWYFDDDGGPGEDPRIRLTRPSEGLYDVWVGTYQSRNCDAVLTVETF